MAISVETLAAAKNYTSKSLIGLGALKGAPCVVKEVEQLSDGVKITLEWTGTDGTAKESKSFVINDGVAIANISIDEDNHLICEMTDGTEIDAGEIASSEGVQSGIWIGTTEPPTDGSYSIWINPEEIVASSPTIEDSEIDDLWGGTP